MKIFSAAQIKACDAYTIHASGIQSIELMERAAHACADRIISRYDRSASFAILCGMGNNGGDGLAIARMLHENGYSVKAFVLRHSAEFSKDCYTNLQRFQSHGADLVSLVEPGAFITGIAPQIVIVDALLGTGLNRAVDGWLADFIRHINELPNEKIAIDIPSGMSADNVSEEDAVMLKADHTYSFQFHKRSFLHPETGMLAGNVHILDIDLSAAFINATPTNYHTTDLAAVKPLFRQRKGFSHKGSYGHALMVAGVQGMMGAAVLATKATARAGAGKVTALVPGCGYNIMQTAIPEAMCEVSGENYITQIKLPEGIDAVGIGPGLGGNTLTTRALAQLLENYKQPLVIDADALNIIAKQPELLAKIPQGSLLTPHPGEFERLFGNSGNSMLQAEQARFQAMRYNLFIILKGHYTIVATPEGECWYNLSGNAGMATGGSGDVLTGMLTALLAQGYPPFDAARLGVWLHGVAGDYAAMAGSKESLIAGDIIDHIGDAFRMLSN